MKQVLQNMRSGKTVLADVPSPQLGRNQVMVATRASLISAGTERMVMDFAQKSLLGKAQERPDLVKKVVEKIQRDGVVATTQSVFSKLEEPLPLGYSAAGEIIAVGSGLEHLYQAGDRVAMAGAGVANHAELNVVPKNLVAPLLESVSYEHGRCATLAAIAMHGFRNSKAGLGDTVLVMGLGLVGQLTAQLAHRAGCRVFALDYDPERVALAKSLGAETHTLGQGMPDALLSTFTKGKGFDAVIICAATDSNEPVENAAKWARDRATVVMTGKVGADIPYGAFMKKELNFVISRSYGPGRYDQAYEQKGQDYPIGFVRWTENDNLAEATRLMADGGLQIEPLVSHRFPVEEAMDAYAMMVDKSIPSLGIVLNYERDIEARQESRIQIRPTEIVSGEIGLGLIGAGAFARGVLLPKLKGFEEARFTGIMTRTGTNAAVTGEKYSFNYATDNAQEILQDNTTQAVVVATRHDTHAALVADALEAGKHVFVEKPLAMSLAELEHVEQVYQQNAGKVLMVGFNRRFSPFVQAIKDHFKEINSPRQVTIRVNAGKLDADNWQNDQHEGGGRLVGEGCHFVDLALYMIGQQPVDVFARSGRGQDVYSISIGFADGSVADIFYTSEGDTSYSKERIELYAGGSVGVIDNFRDAFIRQNGKQIKIRTKGVQDKGHHNELVSFLSAIKGDMANRMPVEDVFMTTRITLLAAQSMQDNMPVSVE